MMFAAITLDLVRLTVQPAAEPIRLTGYRARLNVDYTYRAPDGSDPDDVGTITAKAAKLDADLQLASADNSMLLLIRAGTDILASLTSLQVDWIQERLPLP